MSSSPEPTSCENMVLPDPEKHRIDRERFKEISVPDPSWTETPLITKVGKGKMESFACKKKTTERSIRLKTNKIYLDLTLPNYKALTINVNILVKSSRIGNRVFSGRLWQAIASDAGSLVKDCMYAWTSLVSLSYTHNRTSSFLQVSWLYPLIPQSCFFSQPCFFFFFFSFFFSFHNVN